MSIRFQTRVSALAATAILLAVSPAGAADDSSDRFSMSPVEGGFLKLDKKTGEVSNCARKGTAWSCEPVEDRTTAAAPRGDAAQSDLEIENKELKARVKELEDALDNIASPPAAAGGEPPTPKAQLPTEEEVDQALDYVERMFKKFRDRVRRLDEPLPPGPGDPGSSGSEPNGPARQL